MSYCILFLAHTHCAISLEVALVAHVDSVAVVDYKDMVAIVDDHEALRLLPFLLFLLILTLMLIVASIFVAVNVVLLCYFR